MFTFFFVVIGLGWAFSYALNNPSILYVAVIFALIMNVGSFWYSDKLVLATAGAKRVEEKSQAPDVWNVVENLAITAGIPMPALYIINDPAPNAFATGRDPQHAAVAVTGGLLQMMNRTELEGVIAHELSHIGNRDTLLMMVVAVLLGFVVMLSDFFIRTSMWGGGRSRDEGGQLRIIMMLVGFALAIFAPIFAQLIQLAISRRREFLADADGALLTRYPEGLASALEKIQAYGHPMIHANRATAHLYIESPFGGDETKTSWFARLFMTHPPVEERVEALLGTK